MCAHACIHEWAQKSIEARKRIKFPQAVTAGSCEPLDLVLALNSSPL